MKRICSCLLALLVCCASLMAAPTGVVTGKVLDASTGEAMDYADVIVCDTADHIKASGIVTNGRFRVDNVPAGPILVMVRMTGCETWVSAPFVLREGEVHDFGTIRLSVLAMGLQEVVVSGERNQIVYKLDRRTLNASAALTAAGGTAVDILASTPSVQVDAEGSLTLRGSSNFLVYVDGKPSPLDGTAALQSIPAASINDIEIITTPSARYRTDGDMGIINITTRRDRTSGWSGLLNGSGGTLGTYSVDGVINWHKNRHDLYFGGTEQNIQGRSLFTQQKTTDVEGIRTESLADGKRLSEYGTHTFKGGWQYADGKRHSLSLDLLYGRTSNWRGGDLSYAETRTMPDASSITNNYTSHDRYNLRKDLFQASLDYTLKIDSFNQIVLSNRFRYDKFSREYTESNMFNPQGVRYEGTRGYEDEHHWDCDGSLAWQHDFRRHGKFEAGYQYITYSEHGDYHICYWDRAAEDFIWQDQLATPFYYRRQTHSGYAMAEDKLGAFSYDIGLRADLVLDYTDIGIEGTSRDIQRFNLFPSGHAAWDGGDAGVFSVGCSYRTNRPGIWNLEPYITYEDYYTKKIGNPDIRPEYILSAEGGWRKNWSNGNNFSATAIYRQRTDITDWVRRPYEPGITLDSIVNAGNQRELGLELSSVLHPTDWWSTSLNASIFSIDFRSTCPVCTDRDGWFGQAGWNNTFTLSPSARVQFDAHYVGPRVLTQGRETAYFYADLAARKSFLNGRLAFSAVAHDVLHTAKYNNIRETNGLTSITHVRPVWPNILLSCSYNFNASRHKAATINNNLFEGKEF